MRKLYQEFFQVPENGKISEKVMLARVTLSVVVVIMCLAMMSLTAYAYFSHNVASNSNTIQMANFSAKITIYEAPSNGTQTTQNEETQLAQTEATQQPQVKEIPVERKGRYQIATLPKGTYNIELTKGSSTAKTGFCVLTVGSTERYVEYYTAQIGADAVLAITDAKVTFTLTVPEEMELRVLSHWGTSSYYGYGSTSTLITEKDDDFYIESDDVIDVGAALDRAEGKTPTTSDPGNIEGIITPGTSTDSTQDTEQESGTGSESTDGNIAGNVGPIGATEPTEPATEPQQPPTEATEAAGEKSDADDSASGEATE